MTAEAIAWRAFLAIATAGTGMLAGILWSVSLVLHSISGRPVGADPLFVLMCFGDGALTILVLIFYGAMWRMELKREK